MKNNNLTSKIIQCAYKVHSKLGCGFLEKIYENAMHIECTKVDLPVQIQFPAKVYYDNQIIGDYKADLLVCNNVILELKAVKALEPIHQAQLLNYLKACRIKTGLLLNFGQTSLQIKRMVY